MCARAPDANTSCELLCGVTTLTLPSCPAQYSLSRPASVSHTPTCWSPDAVNSTESSCRRQAGRQPMADAHSVSGTQHGVSCTRSAASGRSPCAGASPAYVSTPWGSPLLPAASKRQVRPRCGRSLLQVWRAAPPHSSTQRGATAALLAGPPPHLGPCEVKDGVVVGQPLCARRVGCVGVQAVWQRVCCGVDNGHTALLIAHTQEPAAVARLWGQGRGRQGRRMHVCTWQCDSTCMRGGWPAAHVVAWLCCPSQSYVWPTQHTTCPQIRCASTKEAPQHATHTCTHLVEGDRVRGAGVTIRIDLDDTCSLAAAAEGMSEATGNAATCRT